MMPAGNLKAEGTFSFTHEKPEDGVLGELITSIPPSEEIMTTTDKRRQQQILAADTG